MKKKSKIWYNKKNILITILLLSIVVTIYAAVSSLVYLDGGHLTYTPFAMQDQTNEVNIIPDYSYAGYMGGGVTLPHIPPTLIKRVVSPNDGDDKLNIQAAINYVESLPKDANGFRGAILLKRGNYQANGTLTIKASGVVLLGEGQGENGTVVTATLTSKHDLITLQGIGRNIVEDTTSTVSIATPYVPVGTKQIDVSDASGFSVGDIISVKKTPNAFWINDLDMAQYGWVESDYEIKHERIITEISNNTLAINIPTVDVIENKYGGGTVSKATVLGRISNCGIQNLRLKSVYSAPTDENHAWSAIVLKRTTNSWVRNVTAVHFAYSCVKIEEESNFNTIEDCANLEPISKITGGRRYSFYIANGLGNLFQRCYSNNGRHDFVTGARVTGPNIFLDCYAEDTYNDIGPHHRWATGTLFDNIYGGQIRTQNRKDYGTGHGWAGVQTMFWNLKSYKDDIKVESPKGAKNWAIGCEGLIKNGDGYWEHWNSRVTPRSLYLQQLKDRLGIQAVENITISEQRTKQTIWQLLKKWSGNGNVIKSIPGNVRNPNPKNGITNVSTTTILTWQTGMDATSHDVYFGTTNPPPFIKNQTDTSFNPGVIQENTIYYWRIDEKNNVGTTKGEIQNFSHLTNMDIDTVNVIEDSFVQGDEYADNNFGTENKLVVKSNNKAKYIREAYLKFNLSSIKEQISHAKLLLKVSKDITDVTHSVSFVSDDSWLENGITYNTKPNLGITLDTKLFPSIGEWIEFDVTSQVQIENRNDKIISFAIWESSYNHYSSYNSKESGTENSPKLIIIHSNPVSVKKKASMLPLSFVLNQNYPNPFNPTTAIKYSIHVGTRYSLFLQNIQLKVYDILGSKVATLVNKKQKVGEYEITFNAKNLPSGIYYCQLQSGNFSKIIKMVLLK